MRSNQEIWQAIYHLYEHSQFSMAGAVAFSFLVSLFPFCILLASVAGIIGDDQLAQQAIEYLFDVLPEDVASGLAPEVRSIMTTSRIDLLTLGGVTAMFFATSAVETLRAALNQAYRVREQRNYFYCLGLSLLHVLASILIILALTWMLLVAPGLARIIDSEFLLNFVNSAWKQSGALYVIAAVVVALLLFAMHMLLVAGHRKLSDVWPGIALTILLWLAIGALYSYYLSYSNYTRFYAGLSQLMVALIFFQIVAVAIILGAELNRGLMALRKMHSQDTTASDK